MEGNTVAVTPWLLQEVLSSKDFYVQNQDGEINVRAARQFSGLLFPSNNPSARLIPSWGRKPTLDSIIFCKYRSATGWLGKLMCVTPDSFGIITTFEPMPFLYRS